MPRTLRELLDTLPQRGRVEWIGLRPARSAPMHHVTAVEATIHGGLDGDRYRGRSGERQVTLMQAEHLAAIGHFLAHPDAVPPEALRRNLVVSGINLLALKGQQFRMGEALLEYTGACHPCSRMEENFGPGGYNAMRGHGGITAKVIEGGTIAVGDVVSLIVSSNEPDHE